MWWPTATVTFGRLPDAIDLGRLLREGRAVALLLHQREADDVVGPVERRHEAVVHAEGEGHEQRALRAAGDRRVAVEGVERAARREDGLDLAAGARRGQRRERLVGERRRLFRPVVVEDVPVARVLLGDRAVAHQVGVVRVAEDAVLAQVGRAGPDLARLAAAAQDEELVVREAARARSRLDHAVEALAGHRRLVGGALAVAVVEDRDRRAACARRAQRRVDARVLELEERAEQRVAGAGLADERLEPLDQPAREPVVRRRADLGRLGFWKRRAYSCEPTAPRLKNTACLPRSTRSVVTVTSTAGPCTSAAGVPLTGTMR